MFCSNAYFVQWQKKFCRNSYSYFKKFLAANGQNKLLPFWVAVQIGSLICKKSLQVELLSAADFLQKISRFSPATKYINVNWDNQ